MRKTRKTTKRVLVSLLSAALMISTLMGCGGKDDSGTDSTKDKGATSAETDSEKDKGASKPKVKSESEKKAISNPRIEADGSVTWDKIKFGSYEQTAKFDEAEPIKWRILSIDEDNNALLLADMGLDCKPYNEEYENVTWENCTLRTWLNEDFYKETFNEEEQAVIKQVKVKNDDNPEYGTKGGKDTTDKVYLLSIEEASNSEYGFDSAFDTDSATRECKVTDYARINVAFRSSGSSGGWRLRSPGDDSGSAAYVVNYGWGNYCGGSVNFVGNAIRPALNINLSSSLVTDAGEVASDGTVTDAGDGYNNPKVTGDKTMWDCVYFGRYKQNISETIKEPIEWRVLSVDGDEALLLADKGLDYMPYNEVNEDVTWETCTLRTWLNEEFYKEAFNESEQSAIKQVTVKNDDNSVYETEGGNDTTDKVYLLSIDEVHDVDNYGTYGIADNYKSRECDVTELALLNGARDGYHWCLRSPGEGSNSVAKLDDDNWPMFKGGSVTSYYAIRPTIRIDLNSPEWELAGTVSVEKKSN